jgi:hypothetical protein
LAKGRTKFTKNLRNAVEQLIEDPDLGLWDTKSWSLFSPVFRGDYIWIKVMDCDGLLVGPRRVKDGEGAKPAEDVNLTVGVVVQSEDSTSQTKPNPFGKAAICHTPNGIWVDRSNGERVRLDRLHILFVLPKGAPPAQQRSFETAKRNVINAAGAMRDTEAVEFPRGVSTATLATALREKIRPWFKGRGRPAKKRDQE